MTDIPGLDSWADAQGVMPRAARAGLHVSRSGVAAVAALAATVILLIGLGALLNINLIRLRDSFTATQRIDTIMMHITGIEQNLFEAETTARAFALTDDASYLVTLHANESEMLIHRKALSELVLNDAQVRKLGPLFALIDARLAQIDRFVRLDDAARQRQAMPTTKAGIAQRLRQRQMSSDIVRQMAEFHASELAQLQNCRLLAEHESARLNVLAAMIAVLASLLGAAGFVLLFHERRNRQARERQSEMMHGQRLALMGETATMLAHELSQPLAAATNYVSVLDHQLAGAELTRPGKVRETLQKTGAQIERAVHILQRLRNFIARGDSERAVESPARVLRDAVALLGSFSAAVRLQTHIEPGLPDLLIDRVQIQQVIVNLLRNALEAMQGRERQELRLSAIADTDGMVRFCLRDSGPGLHADVAGRLFRPFVSTKPEGMGVGLSICQQIVVAHGGRIWAVAADGGGTVFCFTLPGLADEALQAA